MCSFATDQLETQQKWAPAVLPVLFLAALYSGETYDAPSLISR